MGSQTDRQQLTRLLHAWSAGEAPAAEAVLAIVYERVRQLAANKLRANPANGIEPTELAHELVINLLEAHVDWIDRVHFFRTVAVAMRNLLFDMGRKQLAAKHGGGQLRVTFRAAESEPAPDFAEAEALHDALIELRANDPRKADVVELTYLVGLEHEEVAKVLDVSLATVNRDLRFARAFLRDRMQS